MDFKFKIDEIPEKGFHFKKDLEFSFIEPLLTSQWFNIGNLISVEFLAKKHREIVVEEGHIQTTIGFICSRCADDSYYNINLDFLAIFTMEGKEESIDGLSFKESVFPEFYPIIEGFVDLRQPIDEIIVLNLPPYPKCSDTCKGICPNCGKNLNREICTCKKEIINPFFKKLANLKLIKR